MKLGTLLGRMRGAKAPAPLADLLEPLDTKLSRRKLEKIDRFLSAQEATQQPSSVAVLKPQRTRLPRTVHVLSDGSSVVWLRTRIAKGSFKTAKRAARVRYDALGAPSVQRVVKITGHARTAEELEDLRHEVRAYSLLAGVPQIAECIEAHEMPTRDGCKVIVVAPEYERGDLQVVLTQGAGLHLEERDQVMLDALEALSGMHARGVLHRDIKLENIFVGERSGRVRAFLGDFGSHAVVGEEQKASGTLDSLSPQLAAQAYDFLRNRGPAPVSTMADDVFAMGIVLHALEHGRMPAFYARARTQELTLLQRASLQPSGVLRGALRGAPPGSLDDLIARMLSVDAAERPTAAEALAELRSIAARTPLLRADEGP